ncbi:tRNA (guanine(37)-N1)-methyltransferase [Boothiomyces sp. JEL0866]|nr:tRNA (guanine(37)-N1)-methyltransferase [Boothiomyces sp. JEL0866]
MHLLPPANKNITTLNRDLFVLNQKIGALLIPAHSAKRAMDSLRGSGILSIPRSPTVINAPKEYTSKGNFRLLLLNPDVEHSTMSKLPLKLQDFAKEVDAELITHTLQLDYSYWSADQILRSILPDELDIPGSFATIGHIGTAHSHNSTFKFKGRKAKNIKTVVNKTDTIDHTFRFFSMELLAGENNTFAELVYWNSRLQGEHDRLVSLFKEGDIICDVFAGVGICFLIVGPFALPAAKNAGCYVFANDLNPASFESLKSNIHINKLRHRVSAYNLDGREFIKQSLSLVQNKQVWQEFLKEKGILEKQRSNAKKKAVLPFIGDKEFYEIDHFIMNLPATAIEFLDSFAGLYVGHEKAKLPTIHCHCFTKTGEKQVQDTIQRTEAILGTKLGDDLISVTNVRNVAPKKDMMCIAFKLPKAVAYRTLKRKANEI